MLVVDYGNDVVHGYKITEYHGQEYGSDQELVLVRVEDTVEAWLVESVNGQPMVYDLVAYLQNSDERWGVIHHPASRSNLTAYTPRSEGGNW